MSLRFCPISIYFHGFTIIIGGLFFNFIKIVILGYTMVYHIFIPPFRTTPNTLAPVPLQFKAGNPMMNLRLGATFTKIGIGLWHWVTHILPFLMVVFQFLMVPWFWVCTFLMVDLEFRLSRLHPIFGSFLHPTSSAFTSPRHSSPYRWWQASPRGDSRCPYRGPTSTGATLGSEMRKSLIFGFFWWFGNHFLVGWKNMFQRVYITSKSLISNKFLV